MLREPCAQLRRITHEAALPCLVLRGQRRLPVSGILGPMPREHLLRRALHLGGLAFEVGAAPTPLLRRVARQLHAIDGKHLAPNEALAVAHRQDGREDRRDLVAQRADEVGNRREVGPGVTAQRDERDVVLAGLGDGTAAHDPPRVREQDHAEQHRGRIGRAPVRSLR